MRIPPAFRRSQRSALGLRYTVTVAVTSHGCALLGLPKQLYPTLLHDIIVFRNLPMAVRHNASTKYGVVSIKSTGTMADSQLPVGREEIKKTCCLWQGWVHGLQIIAIYLGMLLL